MKPNRLLIPAAMFAAGILTIACDGVHVPPLYQPVVAAAPVHVTWVIATPDMLGSTDKPALIPGNPVLPANTDVTVSIVNFDDATALPTSPATKVASLDPSTGVSHMFTVARLGLNVPMAPKSRTTFTFHTGGAGTYDWQCMDPCGTDPRVGVARWRPPATCGAR